MKKITRWVFHPFLFAVYPVLFLLVNNPEEAAPAQAVRSLLAALLAAAVLLAAFRVLLRSWTRAAVAVTLVLIAFFSYGHVYALVDKAVFFGLMIGRHRYLLPLWLLLTGLGLWWAARKLKNPADTGQAFNLIGTVLLLLVLFQFLNFQARAARAANMELQARLKELGIATITGQLKPPARSSLPDVYYIVLDGYSRANVLQSDFGFDDTSFIAELEKRGFYVAECSQSNYPKTALSLTASLNMEYLQPLGQQLIDAKERWQSFGVYMSHNVVRHTLAELGYKTVAFETGHSWANVSDADVYYAHTASAKTEPINSPGLNSFEKMVVDTTMLSVAGQRIHSLSDAALAATDVPDAGGDDEAVSSEEHAFYNLNSYSLDKLDEVPELPGPKFVYAHLLSTHPPFVFSRQGEFQYSSIEEGYLDAIVYTNQRMLKVVDEILARPGTKPIIIIQADHGRVASPHKSAILNAYYLPDGGSQDLYPTISPVNSFRVVFNRYFGAQLPLLKDISYAYENTTPGIYNFELITDPGPGCPVGQVP